MTSLHHPSSEADQSLSMKKKKNDDDGLESKRLPAVLIEINSRVTSQSSTTSSLEPLVESFEVLTPFSPLNSTHPTPSISLLPSFESSSSSSSSHSDSKLNSPLTITSSSSRQRSKSDTLLEPASHHQQQQHPSESISTYSHFHLLSSLPSTNLNSPHHLTSPLVADIKVAKSRLLITKTHCFYPKEFLNFQSCLLGFQVVFHPCNPKARIKHSEINLSIYSDEDDHESENPVIKAIYPSQGIVHKTGESSMVHHRQETTVGLCLGMDPYGKVALQHTRSRSQQASSAPHLLGSGIETNSLLLTMTEDSVAQGGVMPSLDFAVLLYLPSQVTQAFEAHLTVKTSVGGELGASLLGMWTSPKVWRLKYDGITELGHHTITHHPDGSSLLFLESGHLDSSH